MARLQGGASASRQLPYRWAAAAHSAEHSPGLAGGAGDGQQGAAPAPPFVGRSTAGASSPTLPPAAAGAKAPFNTSESAAAAVAAAVAGPSTSGGGKGTTTANATASATAVSPDHAPDGGGLKDAGPQHQVHTDASADAADSPSVPDATTSPDAAATLPPPPPQLPSRPRSSAAYQPIHSPAQCTLAVWGWVSPRVRRRRRCGTRCEGSGAEESC